MKNFLLGLCLTLATVASLLVLIEGARTHLWPQPDPALARLEERLKRLEAAVVAPPALAREEPADLAKLSERLSEIEGMIWDSERALRKDLKGIFEGLVARMDATRRAAAPSDPTAGMTDPRAKEEVVKKLVEMGIALDLEREQIEVKATVGTPTRVLEYVAVAPGGRAHESLFVVDVIPSALKIAIDALGIPEADEPNPDTLSYADEAGSLYLYAWWEGLREKGRKTPVRVEHMILNQESRDTLQDTPWMYTGSFTYTDTRNWERRFAADMQRSLIGLVWAKGPECLLACPVKETLNENVWIPFADLVPEPGTEVKLFLRKQPEELWDQR